MSSPNIPVSQKALTIPAKQAPHVVAEVDIPKPGPGEVLVRADAVGLNIIDAYIQSTGMFAEKYPCVSGYEAAGTVVQVGEGVTSLSVGNKVLHRGTVLGERGTFKQYNICSAELAAKVPENISLDSAAVIPLCIDTAALGLYAKFGHPGGAELTAPWVEGGRGKYAGQPIFVFGGASSVGLYAIQLAKLSGFSPIITTASLKNADFLKSIGATHVVDRNAPLESLAGTVRDITDVPLKLIYVAIPTPDVPNVAYDLLASEGTLVLAMPRVTIDESKITPDKRIVTIFASKVFDDSRDMAVGLYKSLTSYLASGDIKPNNVEVLEGGLAGIPAGLQRLLAQKVSACKLVARPQETV